MNKVVAVAQLALCLVLVFCNSGSGETMSSQLVGQWVCTKNCDGTTAMELLSDGTAVFEQERGGTLGGTWKVVDNRFVVSAMFLGIAQSIACNYKVSGYELTLVKNSGDTEIYVRKV